MKVTYGEYCVSFNCAMGDYELGEAYENSVNYTGDDMDALIEEVIADDPSFPMIFKPLPDEFEIIGVFVDASDEDHVVAVMYR